MYTMYNDCYVTWRLYYINCIIIVELYIFIIIKLMSSRAAYSRNFCYFINLRKLVNRVHFLCFNLEIDIRLILLVTAEEYIIMYLNIN